MVVAGNLNNDEYIDLAVVNYGSNSVTVLIGNGDGTFTSGVPINSSDGTASGAIADFDGDGFNDIAVTRWLLMPYRYITVTATEHST